MTQLGIKCPVYGPTSHADCRACSVGEHPCEYPTDFLEAIREENDAQHDRTEFTPSTLLECKRRVVLRTSNDYYVDPQGRWKMFRGEALHSEMQKRGKYPAGSVVGTVREVRLKITVPTKYGPQVFSGKSDVLVINSIVDGVAHIKITDYKTTDITHEKDGFSEDHEWSFREQQMQVNMYSWLAQGESTRVVLQDSDEEPLLREFREFRGVSGVVLDELELVYMGWKSMRRFTSNGQLVTRGKLVDRSTWTYAALPLNKIHILPFEVTEHFIVSTIEEMIEYKEEGAALPPLLEGKKASVVCPLCPVREPCFRLAGKST